MRLMFARVDSEDLPGQHHQRQPQPKLDSRQSAATSASAQSRPGLRRGFESQSWFASTPALPEQQVDYNYSGQ